MGRDWASSSREGQGTRGTGSQPRAGGTQPIRPRRNRQADRKPWATHVEEVEPWLVDGGAELGEPHGGPHGEGGVPIGQGGDPGPRLLVGSAQRAVAWRVGRCGVWVEGWEGGGRGVDAHAHAPTRCGASPSAGHTLWWVPASHTHCIYLSKKTHRKILKSWSTSESPWNMARFVSISTRMAPQAHTSTGGA